MYNYSKLLGRIIEIFGDQHSFAKAVGLSQRSVSLKLNNKRGWKQSEMRKCCEVLGISAREIPNYFFDFKVQY